MKTHFRNALAAAAVAACLVITPSLTANAAQPDRVAAEAVAIAAPAAIQVDPNLASYAPMLASRIVPMKSCAYERRYHYDWFQCYSIFGAPVPANCWYYVYICTA